MGKTSLFTFLKLNPSMFGNLKPAYVGQSRFHPLSDLYVSDAFKVIEEEVKGALSWKDNTLSKNLNLELLMDKKVSALSGGENQKLKIALALMTPFDILLLDEPLQNLDKENQELIISFLEELSQDKIVLIIEHDLNKYPNKAGKINVMSNLENRVEVMHDRD